MKEMGRNRKKLLRFEKNDKIRLIAAVKMRRLLWDMMDTEHSDLMGVKEAWQSVGTELGKEPNDCKVAWRSLRQSYRYHCRTANSRNKIDFDDDEGDVDPLETPDIQWEFANHMAFLQDMSKKKISDSDTFKETPTNNSEDYTDMEYLETYEFDQNESDVDANYTGQNDVNYDATNIYYLTQSLKDEDAMIDVLCRTCTQPADAGTSINLFNPHNHKLLRDIQDLTDLQLNRDEDYSDFICEHCQQVLEIATEFRRVCIEAQTQVLINVHMKEEPAEMDCPDPSNADYSIEEDERLELKEKSDNENCCEEPDAQPVTSAVSSPVRRKLKRKPKTLNFQCHECGLTFTSQDLLKMHMHQVHDMQLHTRFVCKHCGHDFKYSGPLVEHLKSIGVNFGYKCEECGQKFHSRHFLKKHKRRIHGQADEHICHICGKNFSTGFNLRNHIVRHAGTRPHKCKQCNAAFSTTAELNNHRRTHDNVRPYPCRYGCGKSFRHCSNRSTHERVHMDSSLRPFQCEYCDKSFVTKGDCRAHQVVHTMSRDFYCDICEQSFKLQKHYQQHLTTKSHKKQETLPRGGTPKSTITMA